MAVMRLVPRRDAESAAILRALAELADQGELVGVALCYRTRNRDEQAVFTGAYKCRPAEAVNAAMRLSWKLTQAQD